MVNPDFKKPRSPGAWVDDHTCSCGCNYATFRAGYTFHDAVYVLRNRAKGEGDEGGGFRSRRPVLWVLRVLKLGLWFQVHEGCGPGRALTGPTIDEVDLAALRERLEDFAY